MIAARGHDGVGEAIAGIESIQRDIGGALAAKETAWGIKLTNFDLQSILPTPEIIAATQRSVVAARTLEEQLRSAEAQALVAARQAEAQVAKERAAAECSVIVQRASAECTRVADEAAASGTRLRGDAEAHALRVAGEARVALWADALKAGFKADAVAQFEMAANWRALAARTTTTLVVPYESATYLGAQPLLRVHDS